MPDQPSTPLVSVLMNCYNSERFLCEAIDSVIAQTHRSWELVFWDNQSTDSSAAIAKSYGDSRIKYHRAPQHTSLGSARGLAMEKASGEFIAILDCDDVWYPPKLERQVAQARSMPEAGLLFSGYDIISETGERRGVAARRAPARSGNVFAALLTQEFTPCWPTVVFRAEALRAVGPFSALRYVEDLEIMLRIAENRSFAYTDERLAAYRVHGSQQSNNYLGMRDEVLTICDNWEEQWQARGELTAEQRGTLARARARAWAIAGKNAVARGESALRMYATSVRYSLSAEGTFGLGASIFGPRAAALMIAGIRRVLGYGNL